jgi:predicted regulator of Ras-like GTPase activity (Roadblock/LC7/MglB family)
MFSEKLENAVTSVGGGKAAILMGFDGIQVDMYNSDADFDMETVGMEMSVVLKEVLNAAEMLEAGEAEEITVKTDQTMTILRIVNDEYFLALAMSSKGNIGKARYLLRIIAPEIAQDLS